MPDIVRDALVITGTAVFPVHAYGRDLGFWGGIETQNFLPFGTPAQVKEKARETIRTLGKGGGLIIGPSQEVMNDVPIENVKALVETIIEERQTVLNN